MEPGGLVLSKRKKSTRAVCERKEAYHLGKGEGPWEKIQHGGNRQKTNCIETKKEEDRNLLERRREQGGPPHWAVKNNAGAEARVNPGHIARELGSSIGNRGKKGIVKAE